MKLYLPTCNPHFVHSYDASVRIEDYRATAYRTHWAIEMPSKDGQSREYFLTLYALSLKRSEVMCGRGTLIWHVVKCDDETKVRADDKCRKHKSDNVL